RQGRGRSPGLSCRCDTHGTGLPPPPPLFACLIFASICWSTSRRPLTRSCGFTLPACHLTMKFVKVVRWSRPIVVIGVVCEFLFTKIFRNVEKFLSGINSFERAELTVDGTFLIPFENLARA